MPGPQNSFEAPTRASRLKIAALSEEWGFDLAEEELSAVESVANQLMDSAWAAAGLTEKLPAVRGLPHRRATADDDPLNAIVRWCDVPPVRAGVLDGLRIAVKDSIAIGGVPLTGGSALLQGYIPSADSTVVSRIRENGGKVVALTNMDSLGWSGSGTSSVYGPTLSPHDHTRSSGGSSSGSAACLYYEEVDAAMGCDQGGSIRLPAAYCGVVGLKPTRGLVPYTGILGIDQDVDHVGPMGRTVDSVARLLQATAGPDGADPRQPAALPTGDYIAAVRDAPSDLSGLRIGVLRQGLDPATIGVETAVRDGFMAAACQLECLGATLIEVSVPSHATGGDLNLAGCIEGVHALLRGGGNGYQWHGRYLPELARTVAEQLHPSAPEWSLQLKTISICGQLLNEKFGGAVYGAAHNQHAELQRMYDRALKEVDYLALPTAPWTAPALQASESPAAQMMRGWKGSANTAPFNISGHPAITLPIGEADGMPVGFMLAGTHFSEASLLATSRTIERAMGWRPQKPSDQGPGQR